MRTSRSRSTLPWPRTSCRTTRSRTRTQRRPHRSTRPTKEVGMGKKRDEYKQLTREELNALAGEELPERAAMSLINANVAAPINAAIALNALSDNSTAIAQATQDAPITQSN